MHGHSQASSPHRWGNQAQRGEGTSPSGAASSLSLSLAKYSFWLTRSYLLGPAPKALQLPFPNSPALVSLFSPLYLVLPAHGVSSTSIALLFPFAPWIPQWLPPLRILSQMPPGRLRVPEFPELCCDVSAYHKQLWCTGVTGLSPSSSWGPI